MRTILLIIVCILFFNTSYSVNPEESKSYLLLNTTSNTELKLSNNYQQFKYQVINFEIENNIDYSHLARKRRKKQDNLMLYVAGGLAVATATLILTSNPENFTTNSSSGVTLGIAAGGTIACGLIVTKYLIDKGR